MCAVGRVDIMVALCLIDFYYCRAFNEAMQGQCRSCYDWAYHGAFSWETKAD